MRVSFKEPLLISGIFIPRRPVPGSRRFAGVLSGFSIVGPERRLVFRLADGPVRAATFTVFPTGGEEVGLDSAGAPVLLSGVTVNGRPLGHLCLEWQRALVS